MSILLFLRREPVRALLYPLILAFAAWLVAKGVVTAEISFWLTGAVALVLGVPATEIVRGKVTPVDKVVDVASEVISTVETQYKDDGKLDANDARVVGGKVVDVLLRRLNITGVPRVR